MDMASMYGPKGPIRHYPPSPPCGWCGEQTFLWHKASLAMLRYVFVCGRCGQCV